MTLVAADYRIHARGAPPDIPARTAAERSKAAAKQADQAAAAAQAAADRAQAAADQVAAAAAALGMDITSLGTDITGLTSRIPTAGGTANQVWAKGPANEDPDWRDPTGAGG